MKKSEKIGLSFGITSGIITTMGLMVGLNSSTNSELAVLGGIFTIAIADSMSDALGMHISQESDKSNTTKQIWESTIATFIAKLIFSGSFAIPVLLFELKTAIIVSIIWGLLVITGLSITISIDQKENPIKSTIEHLFIAVVVIILTNYIGLYISSIFH